jgi:hypothetical protein
VGYGEEKNLAPTGTRTPTSRPSKPLPSPAAYKVSIASKTGFVNNKLYFVDRRQKYKVFYRNNSPPIFLMNMTLFH